MLDTLVGVEIDSTTRASDDVDDVDDVDDIDDINVADDVDDIVDDVDVEATTARTLDDVLEMTAMEDTLEVASLTFMKRFCS